MIIWKCFFIRFVKCSVDGAALKTLILLHVEEFS